MEKDFYFGSPIQMSNWKWQNTWLLTFMAHLFFMLLSPPFHVKKSHAKSATNQMLIIKARAKKEKESSCLFVCLLRKFYLILRYIYNVISTNLKDIDFIKEYHHGYF